MPPDFLYSSLSAELAALATDGLTRRRRQLDAPCAPHTTVEGKPMLAFASNDYLGPVSYTHLDVYKRQILGRQWLAPCMPRNTRTADSDHPPLQSC